MQKNTFINIRIFDQEIARVGFDEFSNSTTFQYNPAYLKANTLLNIFPSTGIIKRVSQVQKFPRFNNSTFKGLPPQLADSLPDKFGSIILKTWLEYNSKSDISILEQLAYISNRGMGALEYEPSKEIPKGSNIDLSSIINVLREVLDLKKSSQEKQLDTEALINIFKIGTSAGGARAKILVSEHKDTCELVPGDLFISEDYNHYLIKLDLGEDAYPREIIEYCYYLIQKEIGIDVMDSKLIDDKHFATERFDRQFGKKQHVLTATGITGWDFTESDNSSYENLFSLCSFLNISHSKIEELYKRMIFNVVLGNTDDHLKNHSFIYNQNTDKWSLSPAYDVTYALNPLLSFTEVNRALSINNKRSRIDLSDVLKIADDFTIKNPRGIIAEVESMIPQMFKLLEGYKVSASVCENMGRKIVKLM